MQDEAAHQGGVLDEAGVDLEHLAAGWGVHVTRRLRVETYEVGFDSSHAKRSVDVSVHRS